MAQIQVHEGTHLNKDIFFNADTLTFDIPTEKHPYIGESIPVSDLEMIEIATYKNVKEVDRNWNLSEAKSEISAYSNWGVAFGILGILGESLYKGKQVTFIAKLKNGIKILATTHERTFNKIIESI